MSLENLNNLLDPVNKIALQAGKKILEIYETEFTVDIKVDHSPLTEADMAAHHSIIDGLSRLGTFPIVSEESADIPFTERKTWETYWLVDPLDGTKEFIKRNGDFTVNIALIHQHEPVLGTIYVPVKDQYYYAARGCGAFKRIGHGREQRINVRAELPEKPVVAGSRSHITADLEAYLGNLPEHELISIGSSLKFCLVAEGVADIYPRLGLTSEWDTGAAQCIVEQAGGIVTDLNGSTIKYNTKESFLNPFFLVFGDLSQNWKKYLK